MGQTQKLNTQIFQKWKALSQPQISPHPWSQALHEAVLRDFCAILKEAPGEGQDTTEEG